MIIQFTFILALVVTLQCAQPGENKCNNRLTAGANLACPIPDDRVCITFFNQCSSDAQCITENGADYKCCLQPNCGLECKKSVMSRGFRCPIPDDRVCKQYLDQCFSDAQCISERGRRYKCCLQPGCGLECKAAVH